ncbi:hypothetical protein PIB30_013289 [Stylosanthes scabra]|uniref:Uncharacterized protein n=1 Tax=Stylosanthes scabra TaxID=79078 RepID=A0ABU6S694_9FABA|nr:hypothetical protein [Stylosanthes scabra]
MYSFQSLSFAADRSNSRLFSRLGPVVVDGIGVSDDTTTSGGVTLRPLRFELDELAAALPMDMMSYWLLVWLLMFKQ